MSTSPDPSIGPAWSALFSLLHPAEIAMVEAFEWIEEPMSADVLEDVLERTFPLGTVDYDLRRLVGAGVVVDWGGASDGLPRAGYWVKFNLPAQHGDSGALVWNIIGASVGIVDAFGGPGEAHGRDETFVEPLLTPPGLNPNQDYGALTDPHMRPLSLEIADDGS